VRGGDLATNTQTARPGLIAKPIRKAVFPVAGLGTRFVPATRRSPRKCCRSSATGCFAGKRYDRGGKLAVVEATLAIGLDRDDLGAEVRGTMGHLLG